ncbi:MAG: peptide chain release factor 1 [Phycisphaerales bacterium]|jgi:peptide chain release factor 1|nr:peptide chain release factor 1 [Phycisphaerales bacterium]
MASSNTLIDKLDELDRHFTDVAEQMNDPEIACDPNKIIALSKEHAGLARIVLPYRNYMKICEERDEAQGLVDDPDEDADLKEIASAELDGLKHQATDAMEDIKGLLVMSKDSDIDSILVEIRAGTGGDEAALFAADLLGMYRRYAEGRKWKFEVLSARPTEMGGFRELVLNIKGHGVWSRLGYEGGGHRVQRVPKTESQGRVHTSAATVAVLAEPKEIDVKIDWANDVNEFVSRAGGPGGQSVNKIESAIKLEHIETGITVSMRDEKSQHKNRAKARRILTTRLYEHHQNKQRAAEAATRKTMIGSGDRSQRIRTYNFPQNRCTDHRLKGEGQEGANFNLDRIILGDLDGMLDALVSHDKAQRLANL